MSNKSEGFVKVKDRIPYHGKGVDELIGAIRKLFADPGNKYAQKIVFEVGVPHIYLEKLVPQGEAPEVPQLSIHDIVRTSEMEEYDTTDTEESKRTAAQKLGEMFEMIQDRSLQAVLILVGSKTKFQKWLGIRLHHSTPTVFGTPLQVLGELPDDAFIICGAPSRVSDIDDIRYSVKGVI